MRHDLVVRVHLEALAVATVGRDHSPGLTDTKQGDDMPKVWGGISGAQAALAVLLSHGPAHGVPPEHAAALMGASPVGRLVTPVAVAP